MLDDLSKLLVPVVIIGRKFKKIGSFDKTLSNLSHTKELMSDQICRLMNEFATIKISHKMRIIRGYEQISNTAVTPFVTIYKSNKIFPQV